MAHVLPETALPFLELELPTLPLPSVDASILALSAVLGLVLIGMYQLSFSARPKPKPVNVRELGKELRGPQSPKHVFSPNPKPLG
ncbi:hypothetical protein Ctob_005424 [Chrysochromulina tobinii]|uniref:Uncharacterized protein n=1 Tax=Chrysochromulina tobinii TaxID=1460289 RepID=A0A0M0JTB2_9EUKA|nr:hypothetical protein Ctob_005424 [Chrysochromulina tobinii]|eukprot:KOO29819.1 hypothetical protein Ctob_005424 [Chrysochromulina sp. CCMP291]